MGKRTNAKMKIKCAPENAADDKELEAPGSTKGKKRTLFVAMGLQRSKKGPWP